MNSNIFLRFDFIISYQNGLNLKHLLLVIIALILYIPETHKHFTHNTTPGDSKNSYGAIYTLNELLFTVAGTIYAVMSLSKCLQKHNVHFLNYHHHAKVTKF